MVQRAPILRQWIVPHATIMRNINRPGYHKYLCCDKLLCCIIIVFFLYMRHDPKIDITSLIAAMNQCDYVKYSVSDSATDCETGNVELPRNRAGDSPAMYGKEIVDYKFK